MRVRCNAKAPAEEGFRQACPRARSRGHPCRVRARVTPRASLPSAFLPVGNGRREWLPRGVEGGGWGVSEGVDFRSVDCGRRHLPCWIDRPRGEWGCGVSAVVCVEHLFCVCFAVYVSACVKILPAQTGIVLRSLNTVRGGETENQIFPTITIGVQGCLP